MYDHKGTTTTENPPATVLIVEDEQFARRAMAFLLSASGYDPAACDSAEEALRRIDNGAHPVAALIDVDLPGMSGLDLVRKLEEMGLGMVTVLITAAEGDRIDRFRRDHSVHYLRKPVEFSRLLNLLPQ